MSEIRFDEIRKKMPDEEIIFVNLRVLLEAGGGGVIEVWREWIKNEKAHPPHRYL